MFTFCPSCASKNIRLLYGNMFHCPDCGFVYYHNTAAATGCIIAVPENSTNSTFHSERLLFLVRNKDPAIGKLDLPGGFIDPGEGILDGLHRELQEEIGWSPQIPQGTSLTEVFTLFASFSNVYQYKNIPYNTCDVYFYLRAPGLCEQDLRIEHSEIAAVRFLKPEEINFDEIAFDSTCRAVKAYLATISRHKLPG